MTTAELLHRRLLEFEHPMTGGDQRAQAAEAACKAARTLLEDRFDLRADFSQLEPQEPEPPEPRRRAFAAVRDFFAGVGAGRRPRRHGKRGNVEEGWTRRATQ